MRKLKNPQVYGCGHCGKRVHGAVACANHEKRCRRNPDNQHRCFGCISLKWMPSHNEVDMDGHLARISPGYFYCEATGMCMYSYKKDGQHWLDGYGEDLVRMPLECEDFTQEDCPSWDKVGSAGL